MENAKCTQNNAIYSAEQFAELPREDFLKWRQSLVCTECERRAFFRRESYNGRDSCFGARPHADGCQQRAAPTFSNPHGAGVNTQSPSPDTEIVIDLSYGSSQPTSVSPFNGGDDSADPEDEFAAYERHLRNEMAAESSIRHMRLRPLLKLVLTRPEFRFSDQILNFPGMGRIRARDFLVPLVDLTAEHEGHTLGVFGRIKYAQYYDQPGCVWLFSDGFYTPNIQLTASEAGFLMSRYKAPNLSFLANSQVLVIGTVRVSRSDSVYFYSDDHRRMVVDNRGMY